MITNEVIFFIGYSFFLSGVGIRESVLLGFRESGVGNPFFFVSGVARRESGHRLLISGAVAAGVIAAAPEGFSLFGAFFYHAL